MLLPAIRDSMKPHEIFRQSSSSVRLSFSGGELKTREADTSLGIAVRVLSGRRLGFAYCQGEDGLADAIRRAELGSAHAVESGFSFAPPAASFPEPRILDESFDPEDIARLGAVVDSAREAAESLGGRARVIFGADRGLASIENSEGLRGSYAMSAFSLYAETMDADGFGYAYAASNMFPDGAEGIGKRAAEMAKAMQGAGKPDGGTYTVVMAPEALDNLIDPLMPSFSGDWKRRGITKLSAGEVFFSEKLAIFEDPLGPGIGARPFDDEGTPSRKKALVECGAVESFMYDREAAALAGVDEAGSCERGSYDSPPGIGASNITISPGDLGDAGELGRHIEVVSAHGSHTANTTSGDIGLEVSAAFLVENGVRKPLKGFMLSGNIFEMFANIRGLEKRQQTCGSLTAPRIAFGNVRVVS